MLGVLVYLYFMALGYIYSCRVFKDKDIYFRAWMGGVFGNVTLMAGIVIPSLFCGFTYLSHIILVLLSALPVAYIIKESGIDGFKTMLGANTPQILQTSKKSKAEIIPSETESGITWKTFAFVIAPITLIIWVLLTNHILAPHESGGYASGQCTYGDLQMHLGFISSIAEQGKFPPNYAFLDGTTMNYPFFVEMLSSTMFLFGTPLRYATLIPSYTITLLLVMGFYILSYKVTQNRASSVLATVFFFFCGGLGFAYFFEGAKADSAAFTKIFTDFYHTPTNFNEENIRWSNTICDMIIPQRTTMAGWFMLMPTLWLLIDAIKTKSRVRYITLGLLAGTMPMIHTHSFLALGMICAVLFFIYLTGEDDKRKYVTSWVIFGGIVAVMAMPQLFYWTFRQTVGNESFLRWQFNWVNHDDPYLWFYLKNWGITALFALPAILKASKENKKLMGAALFIFVVAEVVLFQPNEYDNNKLFYVVYMLLVIIVSDWLVYMWNTLKDVKGRAYLAVLVIIAGTLSGALTMVREYVSGAQYQTYDENDIAMAEYIRENTPSDAVFLTSAEHLNPVVSLAGRNIYVGSSLYVYFHGMGNEYYERTSAMKKAYSSSYEELMSFCEGNGIDYVYVGANENNSQDIDVNMNTISRLELVHKEGTESLYKVN